MPWITRSGLETLKRDRDVALASLAAEQARRERLELEYDRMRADFQGLVHITAGRVPPRLGTPLIDRDPFEELPTKPGMESWLSPSPDEFVIPDVEITGVTEEASGGA